MLSTNYAVISPYVESCVGGGQVLVGAVALTL